MHSKSELPFESIEEVFIEARRHMASFLSPGSDVLSAILRANWVSDLPPPGHYGIAAIDGSSNSDYLTLGQVIYVASASLFMKDDEVKRARKYQVGVMDDFHHRERVSFCRETMEIKMALRSLDFNPDIVLMDGSFLASVDRGLLATPYGQKVPYYMRKILMKVESYVGRDLTEGFSSLTHLMDFSTSIESLIESILRDELGRDPKGDEIMRAKAFIERYEKLVSLDRLLRESRAVLVAVAKRSGSRSYFNARVPDMEVIRRCSGPDPGLLVPKITYLTFPDFSGIENSYPISVTYAKLEKGANPLRIEVVGEVDLDELSSIVSALARYSVRGYPYHLRIAHEMTKIGKEMMAHLAKNLMIPEISGREILGE